MSHTKFYIYRYEAANDEFIDITHYIDEKTLRLGWTEIRPYGKEKSQQWKKNKAKIGNTAIDDLLVLKRYTQSHIYDLFEKRTVEVC